MLPRFVTRRVQFLIVHDVSVWSKKTERTECGRWRDCLLTGQGNGEVEADGTTKHQKNWAKNKLARWPGSNPRSKEILYLQLQDRSYMPRTRTHRGSQRRTKKATLWPLADEHRRRRRCVPVKGVSICSQRVRISESETRAR